MLNEFLTFKHLIFTLIFIFILPFFLFWHFFSLLLFATVPISRTNAYTQWALWFIFNLRIKQGVIICTTNYICYIQYCDYPSWSATEKTYTYLSDLASSALQWISPSLPLSQSRLIHICPPRDLGSFRELFTLMTWLGCPPLGLPRSCCRTKSQTRALINHTDTHHN